MEHDRRQKGIDCSIDIHYVKRNTERTQADEDDENLK